MTDLSRTELGDLLRTRRAKLRPEAVGFSAGRLRRTSRLRREEVAELAGIGVDWYTRLEQGRAVAPSPTTVDALARALRLDKAEHAHLKALAGTAGRRGFAPETVPPTLRTLVERLGQPAYVTGRRWDVLAWNAAADAIFGFGRLGADERNILLCVLARDDGRALFGEGWAEEARRMVAQFRATQDLWAGDPAFVALLDVLEHPCPGVCGLGGAITTSALAGRDASASYHPEGACSTSTTQLSSRTTIPRSSSRSIRRWAERLQSPVARQRSARSNRSGRLRPAAVSAPSHCPQFAPFSAAGELTATISYSLAFRSKGSVLLLIR